MDNTLVTKTLKPSLSFAREWAAAVSGGGDVDPRAVFVRGVRQGYGKLGFDRSMCGEPLNLAGKVYKHGLGTHADSEIRIRANQPIRAIRAWAGMDYNADCRKANANNPDRLLFSVEADGRELWRSAALGVDSRPVRVEVAAGGATVLVLKVWDVKGNSDWGHADWADAEIELADGTRVRPTSGGVFATELLTDPIVPFSFQYGGRSAAELLSGWKMTAREISSEGGVATREVVWRDPETGLECVLELKTFAKLPAVEWVMRFRNTGKQDTSLLENIRPLDMAWEPDKDRSFTRDETLLRRSLGSLHQRHAIDFHYRVDQLITGSTIAMTPKCGCSSDAWLPFFNLQSGNAGVMVGIGWSGQWAAEFARPAETPIRVRAGQELTRLKLHPGEEIRTPRILLIFWNGEPLAGHNLLRRFILKHHTPRPGGKMLQAPLTVGHWGSTKTAEQLERIELYRKQKLGYEYFWIDAGWYGPAKGNSPDDWWRHVGNWNVNPAAHPNGLRPISAAAKAAGMKFLLWFEPERAVCGTPLSVEHPEWFLGEAKPGANLLFNLGLPEARKWLTEYITTFMKKQGILLYRQDFNFEGPLPYWRAADAPDRQGMSEIRHIEGLYEFWDAILESQPGMVIDNCAGGGRRIDLETLSRSIALWRTDWPCSGTSDGMPGQTHTMGLNYWVPLSGTGVVAADTYNFRSSLSAALSCQVFPCENYSKYPWAWHKRMLADYRRARPLFYGDYYPLTANATENDVWAVFQMHRPDLGEGLLLAFRRKDSSFESARFRLHALDPAATYELTDADTRRKWRVKGLELIEKGLHIAIGAAPASRLVFYRAAPKYKGS
jgi:alpha-galactosidase